MEERILDCKPDDIFTFNMLLGLLMMLTYGIAFFVGLSIGSRRIQTPTQDHPHAE